MLKKEQNDYLTQTGPNTPMGELFRRYWHPALLSEELPEPDCPPVRLEILSEKMLAFRDSSGRLGVIDEFCAHRGVSLWFGRNEENGSIQRRYAHTHTPFHNPPFFMTLYVHPSLIHSG